MTKAKYGYCAVTADFLHIGHINFLNKCQAHCEHLIVGVMSDQSVKKYKGRAPIMKFADRKKIIESLKIPFQVFVQDSFEFPHQVKRLKDFHGKDFIIFDTSEHKRKGYDILIKRTPGISSSMLRGKK